MIASCVIRVGMRIDNDERKFGDGRNKVYQVNYSEAGINQHRAIAAFKEVDVVNVIVTDAPYFFADLRYLEPGMYRQVCLAGLSYRRQA